MTQKDTELIIDAIDFYNLNHLRGKETKKQLNKIKSKVQALNIHNVREPFLKWGDVTIGFIAAVFLTGVILGQIFNAL